jgi:RHS repeat-associated protein
MFFITFTCYQWLSLIDKVNGYDIIYSFAATSPPEPLTEESKQDQYPAATMETANTVNENKIYSNIDNTRTAKPSWFSDPLYTSSTQVARVKNTVGSQKTGPGILLKVMAGDSYNIRVASGWSGSSPTQGASSNVLAELLNTLSTGLAGQSSGKATALQLQNPISGLSNVINSFLGNQPVAAGKPKAYLNWVLFDEQFKIDMVNSSFQQVGASGITTQHVLNNLPVSKSGYLYIYVSNESDNTDVFFDNLQVTHNRGPILEETHYYPFGLTMAGISSKAAGKLENKYKYNKGSELQSKEFSDGSGLEMYDTHFRQLDPQLGRWWQIDPKPDYAQSLYSAMGNNPISFNDPFGDTLGISFRGGFLGLGKRHEVNYNNGSLTNKDGFAYGGKVKGFLKQSVNALNKINGTTDGGKVVSALQSSTNTFTVKDASQNPNHPGNSEFIETDRKASYGVALTAAGQASSSGGSGGSIYWNSAGTELPVVGGTGISPITDLAHEMFHGYESNFGMLNNDDPQGTGLARMEYRASYFENQIRAALSPAQPLRTGYNFKDATSTPQLANLLDASGKPIYVPPTFIPPSLLPINLIY